MPDNDRLDSPARPPPGGEPGAVEAWALAQSAARMTEAADGGAEALMAAVRLNWRLWTILQGELMDPTCKVPTEVRDNILSLAKFIDKHTVEYIADPKPEMVEVLISINRELSAGLSGTADA